MNMGKKNMARKPKPQRKAFNEANQLQSDATRIWMKRVRPVCVTEAYVYLFNIAQIVLHDYFGFGNVRLERFSEQVMRYMESIGERYVTLEEIQEEVEKISGYQFRLGKEEVDILESYGMTTASKELELTAIQKGYLKFDGFDRRMKPVKEAK